MPLLKSQKHWLVMVAACVCAWAVLEAMSAGGPRVSEGQSSGVFTPAHPTALAAVRDFFDRHPAQPVQPIAFTHKVHLAKGLKCEACHVGVDTGAEAAIPGVQFCMSCHQVIAKDRPEIKKLAGYTERGEDISWVRVYNYSSSAHVQFNNAPHIRAEVPCSACHGEMGEQTTARRVVNMNMGFCIGCHTQRSVSVDCLTCHF